MVRRLFLFLLQPGGGGYGEPLLSSCTTVPLPDAGEPSSKRTMVSVRRLCSRRISPRTSFPNFGMIKLCPFCVTPGHFFIFIFLTSTIEQRMTPCSVCSGSLSPPSNGSSAIVLKSALVLNSFL